MTQSFKKFIEDSGFWFIDIPRTSSSSTRLSLFKMFGKGYGKSNIFEKEFAKQSFYRDHLTANESFLFFGANSWRKLNKFTIVRNSWERVYSIYGYLLRANLIPAEISFSDFIKEIYKIFSNKESELKIWPKTLYSSVNFLRVYDGSIDKSIRILNYENRLEELENYFNEFNIKFEPAEQLMKSNLGKSYRDAYSDMEIKLVEKIYSEDIVRFDQKF